MDHSPLPSHQARVRTAASRFAKSAAGSIPPVRRLIAQRDHLLRQREQLRAELRAQASAMAAERKALAAIAATGAAAGGGPERTDLGHLFVLTYGRSGSTLLQNLLATAPGVLIRGENHGVPYQLYRYHSEILRHRDRLARPTPLPPTHPWFGIDGYPEEYALAGMRRLVTDTLLRPLPETRIVGFKEINWPFDELGPYLGFLRALFPGARFVVNTRRIEDVARSKWWAGRADAVAHLTQLEERILAAAAELGDDAFHVRYDDYKDDPEALRPLFSWLGGGYDEARLRAVMAERHSY